MIAAERIAMLTRLADGDVETAFASMLADRDQYRIRALAAEKALSDIRIAHLKIEREWRAAASESKGEGSTSV